MELSWPPAPDGAILGSDDVHVWVVRLDLSEVRRAALACLLSPDERARAARLRRRESMHRFVTARGQLREWLSRYLDVDPAAICFQYDKNGKPRLNASMPDSAIHFNSSHAGGLALFAITRGARLGVDVEAIAAFPDMAAAARSHFSMTEQRQLDTVPPSGYTAAFFRCWTRKEAYVKAIGTGLLTALDSFDVEIADDSHPSVLRVAGDPDAPRRWSLVHLIPSPAYVGTIAVERPNAAVHCWRLDS